MTNTKPSPPASPSLLDGAAASEGLTRTQRALLEGDVTRPIGRPSAFHRAGYSDLPGKPLTGAVDVTDPGQLFFPRAVARHAGLYSHLALAAATGPHGPDLAAVNLERVGQVLGRSSRWVYQAMRALGSYGFIYSIPATSALAAEGCVRLYCLRVPIAAFNPSAALPGTVDPAGSGNDESGDAAADGEASGTVDRPGSGDDASGDAAADREASGDDGPAASEAAADRRVAPQEGATDESKAASPPTAPAGQPADDPSPEAVRPARSDWFFRADTPPLWLGRRSRDVLPVTVREIFNLRARRTAELRRKKLLGRCRFEVPVPDPAYMRREFEHGKPRSFDGISADVLEQVFGKYVSWPLMRATLDSRYGAPADTPTAYTIERAYDAEARRNYARELHRDYLENWDDTFGYGRRSEMPNRTCVSLRGTPRFDVGAYQKAGGIGVIPEHDAIIRGTQFVYLLGCFHGPGCRCGVSHDRFRRKPHAAVDEFPKVKDEKPSPADFYTAKPPLV